MIITAASAPSATYHTNPTKSHEASTYSTSYARRHWWCRRGFVVSGNGAHGEGCGAESVCLVRRPEGLRPDAAQMAHVFGRGQMHRLRLVRGCLQDREPCAASVPLFPHVDRALHHQEARARLGRAAR